MLSSGYRRLTAMPVKMLTSYWLATSVTSSCKQVKQHSLSNKLITNLSVLQYGH